jgi:hypothetical protein
MLPARFRPEPDALAEALSKTLRDPSHAPAFFRELLNSHLHSFARGEELVHFADASGGEFIPIFSRASLLPKAPEGCERLELQGRELLERARGKGRIVINPGSKEFKAFSAQDVERILDRLVVSRFQV